MDNKSVSAGVLTWRVWVLLSSFVRGGRGAGGGGGALRRGPRGGGRARAGGGGGGAGGAGGGGRGAGGGWEGGGGRGGRGGRRGQHGPHQQSGRRDPHFVPRWSRARHEGSRSVLGVHQGAEYVASRDPEEVDPGRPRQLIGRVRLAALVGHHVVATGHPVELVGRMES